MSESESTDGETGGDERELVPLDTAGEVQLPLVEVLTGRAFVTGKSGSGKSNSANVLAEEVLDRGYPLLIVDTDGEYWGLKEAYEMLHVGGDDGCDHQVGPEHGEWLAERALEDSIPIILDVSGFVDEDEADEVVYETLRHLFAKGKQLKRPYLTIVEEVHEYIPQQGSQSAAGDMVVKIGKRGRKHGLGLVGISQRPADVKKDYISQCDWLLWHRLTWNNDTKVVRRVVGNEPASEVDDLDDGEAFLQADFLEADVQRVQLRRMRTFDAGATPDLDGFDRPDLKSVGGDILGDLEEITTEQERREDRVEQLEERVEDLQTELEDKDARIERLLDLREMVESVDGIDSPGGTAAGEETGDSAAAGVDATASLSPETVSIEMDGQSVEMPEAIEAEVLEIQERKDELAATVDEKEAQIAELNERVAELEAEVEEKDERLAALETVANQRDVLEEAVTRMADALDVEIGTGGAQRPASESADAETADGRASDLKDQLEQVRAERDELRERVADLEDAASEGKTGGGGETEYGGDLTSLLRHEVVQAAVEKAKENGKPADDHFERVLSVLATTDGSAASVAEIAAPLDISERTVRGVVNPLATVGVLETEGKRPKKYRVDQDTLETRIDVARKQAEVAGATGQS